MNVDMNIIMDSLHKIISDIKGQEFAAKLSDNDIFSLVGVDSIDYVEIMVNFEELYNCDILSLEIDWSEINTKTKLGAMLCNHITKK
jgi:acyl carrier protein